MLNFSFSKKVTWLGLAKFQLAFCSLWFQNPFSFGFCLYICLLVSSLGPDQWKGHSLVLRPIGMLLQSSPHTPRSRMSPGLHTQLNVLFMSLLLFCHFSNSFWCLGDPTFLVVWLESWGFTFHNCVSLCGQAARGQWVKERGILLFLLGQFLCQRAFGACPGAAAIAWAPRLEWKRKPRRLPSLSLSVWTPVLLLRPEIEGFSGAFSLCVHVQVQLLSPGQEVLGKQWETALLWWHFEFWFPFSVCLPAAVSQSSGTFV